MNRTELDLFSVMFSKMNRTELDLFSVMFSKMNRTELDLFSVMFSKMDRTELGLFSVMFSKMDRTELDDLKTGMEKERCKINYFQDKISNIAKSVDGVKMENNSMSKYFLYISIFIYILY